MKPETKETNTKNVEVWEYKKANYSHDEISMHHMDLSTIKKRTLKIPSKIDKRGYFKVIEITRKNNDGVKFTISLYD